MFRLIATRHPPPATRERIALAVAEMNGCDIVQHVALNTWTNYFNEVSATHIDFPVGQARKAA